MASQCWAVVVYFENEIETEAVVPSCWVKDDWLFWPTGVHVMKAAYKKFPIDDSWNKFRVKRIKVTGDKEVCEGYNFTTTEDSEEESYMFNTQENHLRSQVHPDVTNSTRDRSRSPIVQSKIVNFEINNSKSPKLPLHPKSITTNFKSSELGLQKKLDLSSSSSPAFLAGTSTQSFGTSSQFPLSTEKFQKKVFKQLLEIKNMVKDLQNVSSVVSEDLQINALSSIEQLIELDITLNDSVIFSKWVSQIAKIGGVNLKDNVKRVIERLLTIELRCLLNMKGQTNSMNKTKQKLAFSKTKLYRVLVESVSKRYPDEAGIYEAVKSILKYSPINFCRKQKLEV